MAFYVIHNGFEDEAICIEGILQGPENSEKLIQNIIIEYRQAYETFCILPSRREARVYSPEYKYGDFKKILKEKEALFYATWAEDVFKYIVKIHPSFTYIEYETIDTYGLR